jgi:hypothetical protein
MYCDGVNHWRRIGFGWNFRDVEMFAYAGPCPDGCSMHVTNGGEENEQKD